MKFYFISIFLLICYVGNGQDDRMGLNEAIVPAADRPMLYISLLEDKNVGLVVNQTSIAMGQHLVDFLLASDVSVGRIFSPEHGFRGEASAGAKVADGVDEETGTEIVSLYGKHKKPSAADLMGLDVVVFDLQDVGVRFYTFISTLHLVMEACAENGVPLIVLDRPNPNGYYIDGPVLEEEYRSFVGMHPIPVVYGMTIGELALMINGEGWLNNGLKCDLTVIPVGRYDHTMTYDLPVKPSPNLPNHRSILLYPSLCFFEGTTVSVGRGTDYQFQVIGHPDMQLGSYSFIPESRPGAIHPKHEGKRLLGTSLISLQPSDIMRWKQLQLGYLIGYYEYLSRHSKFFLENDFFDKLAGTGQLRKQLINGISEEEIRRSWSEGIADFKEKRSKYLLYPDFE